MLYWLMLTGCSMGLVLQQRFHYNPLKGRYGGEGVLYLKVGLYIQTQKRGRINVVFQIVTKHIKKQRI